jgi:hypothetical protein
MKKILATVIFLLSAESLYAEEVWLQVKESLLRAEPRFYARTVAPVRYGDRLQAVSKDGGWVKVQLKTAQGYLPGASVSPKRIVLSGARAVSVEADAADVVLAGKGFGKEIEEQYRRSGAGLRYDLVDLVERSSTVTPGDVAQFAKKGGLK